MNIDHNARTVSRMRFWRIRVVSDQSIMSFPQIIICLFVLKRQLGEYPASPVDYLQRLDDANEFLDSAVATGFHARHKNFVRRLASGALCGRDRRVSWRGNRCRGNVDVEAVAWGHA